MNWTVINLDDSGIIIELNFKSSIEISQGDEPDLLLIQLDLSEFISESGQPLQESLVKYVNLPK